MDWGTFLALVAGGGVSIATTVITDGWKDRRQERRRARDESRSLIEKLIDAMTLQARDSAVLMTLYSGTGELDKASTEKADLVFNSMLTHGYTADSIAARIATPEVRRIVGEYHKTLLANPVIDDPILVRKQIPILRDALHRAITRLGETWQAQ